MAAFEPTYTTSSCCNVIWTSWATNTTVTSYDVWPSWTTTTTSITAAVTNATGVWVEWARTQAAHRRVQEARRAAQHVAPYVPRKKTDAEVQAELKAAAERRRQEDERVARELAAKQRAEKLLLDGLTPEQRDDLQKRKCFYLHTRSGKKYRIDRHTHGNVYLLDEKGSILKKFCAQPSGVPVDDAILAQKLALETDEEAFLRVANATNMR